MLDLETARDSLQKALTDAERRLTEAQEKARWRERDLTAALDESKASNKNLEEDKKNLEIRLSAATQDANDLRVSKGGRLGRNTLSGRTLATLKRRLL